MRYGYELGRNGPYLRVILPDVLPPDWDALRREVGSEIDDGATRVMVMAGDCVSFETGGDRLGAMVQSLKDEEIEVVVVRQEEPSFGDVVPFQETLGLPRR